MALVRRAAWVTRSLLGGGLSADPTAVAGVPNGVHRLLHVRSWASAASSPVEPQPQAPHWVFLGAPGVGKGTYSTRVAKALNVPHIACGDLVRNEIKSGSARGQQMRDTVKAGGLLADGVVFELLEEKLAEYASTGKTGFVLDGFPRTASQAATLQKKLDIHLAVNLSLAEEVLIEKCMGRRVCSKCKKNWNIAEINLPASEGRPAIFMPPLDPPKDCMQYMETREDDTEPVIRKRLEVYKAEASPVEQFYKDQNILLNFEIVAGIPETLPVLVSTLKETVGGDMFLKEATA